MEIKNKLTVTKVGGKDGWGERSGGVKWRQLYLNNKKNINIKKGHKGSQ